MTLYVESSAVLAWLLEEPGSEAVVEQLASAEMVVTSELTIVETHRILVRSVAIERLAEPVAGRCLMRLNRAARHWLVLQFVDEVCERAGRSLPGEPIRTLDAFHLSFGLFAQTLASEMGFLSLDRRIRESAGLLGFEVLPA